MGNRGCLHDDHQEIRRQYRGKRWIICLLDFKGRRRSIMTPGRYTELFFLDEATALAAGHRPCAECQRARFNLFRKIWGQANLELVGTVPPKADSLDAFLHGERIGKRNHEQRFRNSIEDLPDGVFVTDDEQTPYLVLGKQLLRWSPDGYQHPPVPTIRFPARVLTPASVVRTLAAGYPVDIHPSASQVGV